MKRSSAVLGGYDRNGHLHRKFRAVGPSRDHLTPVVVAAAGKDRRQRVVRIPRAIAGINKLVQTTPHRLLGRPAEQLLGRGIPLRHATTDVRDNKRIVGRVDELPGAGLVVTKLGRDPLRLTLLALKVQSQRLAIHRHIDRADRQLGMLMRDGLAGLRHAWPPMCPCRGTHPRPHRYIGDPHQYMNHNAADSVFSRSDPPRPINPPQLAPDSTFRH
jgi:hypothetical protein